MATPIFICGAECGVVDVGFSGTGNRHWDLASGTVTADTTTVRNGLRSFRVNASAGAIVRYRTISSTRVVGRLAVLFASLPTSDVNLIRLANSNGNLGIWYRSSGTNLVASIGTGGDASGPAVTTNVWYVLDWDAASSGATATLDWQVDATPQTQATNSQATASMTLFGFGALTTTTADMYFDDIILSYTAADYPFGDGKVLGYSPNASGSHSFTAGDFQDELSGDIALPAGDVHTRLDERPITSIADYIKQVVINSVGYIRASFESTSETTDARGVMVVSCQHSSGTTANTATLKLDDGGTLDDVYSGDISQVSAIYTDKCYAAPPSGGTWQQAIINALAIRWGYSDNIASVPYLDGVILEIEWAVLAVTPKTVSDSLSLLESMTVRALATLQETLVLSDSAVIVGSQLVSITDELGILEGLSAYALYLPADYPAADLVRVARTTHISLLERLQSCKTDVYTAIRKKKKPVYRL